MGFRTTFVSEDMCPKWPSWFREKHSKWVNIPEDIGCISSKCETKFYEVYSNTEFFLDIQKVLKSDNVLNLVLFHECYGVDRVQISKEGIYGASLKLDENTQEVHHGYGHGSHPLKKEEK